MRTTRHHHLRTATIGTLLAIIPMACSGTALAQTTTPFRGEFVKTNTNIPDPLCGGLRVEATGSGTATKLGAATWSSTECVDFLANPGRVRVRDGRAVLTSASGDRLDISYQGDADLPSLAGDVHVDGSFAITGGTGRFEGATGAGALTADTNLTRNDVVIQMAGTIALRQEHRPAGSGPAGRSRQSAPPGAGWL